ncbi:MAG: tetratricopeptide repeat protein [Bacteroidota bacterium]|nr:tetratricopeptide repeat protein [Bacteroidota bacterium]
MKKYLCLLIIVFIIPLVTLKGQVFVKVSKSDFKTEKEGFRDAWKSIKDGDALFKSGVGLYPQAAICYLIANDYNSNNAELNYKIGVSYLFGSEPLKSLDYFLKAYEINPDVTEDILLLTGKSYQYRGDYGKAIDSYNMYSDKYHDSGSFNTQVNSFINQCNRAIDMAGDENHAEVINAGLNINSEYDDYSPVLSNKDRLMYFTTRRALDEKRRRQDADMKWDENIFVATREGDGWDPAGPAGDELTTMLNEGVLSVLANGQLMYLYAGYEGNGDIFTSEFERGGWTKPARIDIDLNSRKRETSISFSEDGNEVFFTSDMRKSIGGRDIFYMKRVRKNKWTKPYNLGETVNSEYNEESVHVSENGDTIWFSSNRPGGMGGYDIYMSVKDDIGLWSDPVNIGVPANSQSNDLFYKPGKINRNEAWLASDRPGGYGGFDIYRLVRIHDKDTLPGVINDTLIIEKDTVSIIPDTLDTMKYQQWNK